MSEQTNFLETQMETDSMRWIDAVLADGEHVARLRSDLPYFAEHALKLRPKSGPLEPFILNPAQRKLHEIIEQQKAKTGRVRVIVLKARQLGVSTYVAARLYQRTIHNPGVRTIIIGHERRASSNLFQIVKRFHEHSPEDTRPSISTSNAEELIFDRMDSGYIVSVATSEGTGRSATAQLLHASEAAFWSDLPRQAAPQQLGRFRDQSSRHSTGFMKVRDCIDPSQSRTRF
jgi:hypothetical protein